jgi:predicted transcriptional regulator
MDTMNSERFLSAFNQIHDFFKKELGGQRYIGFMEGLNNLRTKNYILAKYFDELSVYNDLRNVIVHKKNKVDFVIAEPHAETVQKIENILAYLINPEKVYPKFKSDVKKFNITNSLFDVLVEVKNRGFSQFPIYKENRFIGLLTENGITNWLAKNVLEDLFSLTETTIGDIIGFEEKDNNFDFISRNVSIYQAKEMFLNHLEKGSVKLDAILITENGKTEETLLGIITPWDVIDL